MKFDSGTKVFKGVWAGKREINGESYHYLQFDGLLKGEGRYLDVMIPLKGKSSPAIEIGPGGNLTETKALVPRPGDVMFKESDKRINGDRPAYLIFQIYSNIDMKPFYALFNQKVGQVSDPKDILKEHFNYVIEDPQYPIALVKLDFVLNYSYSARALVWEKGIGEKAHVVCEGLDLDKYDGPRFNIEWNERSKLIYGLRQAGYIGTVVADVVTSPVQLIYLLLVAASGGGVR